MLTFRDVVDRLKQQDEVSLLEILDITSEELVEKFLDKIEERLDSLIEELEEEDIDGN